MYKNQVIPQRKVKKKTFICKNLKTDGKEIVKQD